MASIKKKSSGGGGANWMDTYGDMVTLLLCFFVLLYSMSTIDTKKWEWIVQQFNKDYDPTQQVEPGPEPGPNHSTGGNDLPATQVDDAMDELYQFLKSYAQNNTDASISVSQGDGYVFISFDDAVFFDGNSSQIRPEGAAILDALIPALTKAGPFIDELEVLGHTAQATPYGPNPTLADRNLSCLRASEVASYFQDRIDGNILDPGRLVAKGFGQWRPVADNEDSVQKAKNRRVEMVVTGKNLEDHMQDKFQQYYTMYKTTTGQATGGSE